LVSGIDDTKENSLTVYSEILLKISKKLNLGNQQKLLDFANMLSSIQRNHSEEFPLLNDPKKYAQEIFDKYTTKDLPVEPLKMTNALGVEVLRANLKGECEGMVFKDSKVMVIDDEVVSESRFKFLVATFIGHIVIPWHTEARYYMRKNNESTLQTEDTDLIEAISFATNLLTPPHELTNDFKMLNEKNEVSIREIKKLANEKYQVSLSSLCNRLSEYNPKKFSVVYSKDFYIKKTHHSVPGLKEKNEELHRESKAYSFFDNPSVEEEVRQGNVPSSIWFNNEKNTALYESTIYNPKYKGAVTLLTEG
jgi:Zn-dependent peptidase ImmA (M78 family)